ncbi:unnamed protein product [Zymoseptoria tritici ST99CH_1A5]|uniref:C2H2-type domain-containing protein n=1 Tax=Zymoseptoria tritici ST99CH_1A5 TaxID=1276529 RepID=A0A1Y6LJY3_ZYMTR|nr:unnamed protein product [Zymoseptoria tritici ST99CH_1A5]
MSTFTETLDRLTSALNTLRLDHQDAATLRHLATVHAINLLDPSKLTGHLSPDDRFREADILANSFVHRYANELWPTTTVLEEVDRATQVFDVFVQLLQLPIDVPDNELVRQLAPPAGLAPATSTGPTPGPSTAPAPTPHAGLPPAPWADPPPASPGRRIVSAPEELTTRAQIARPRTLEERVADLEEKDRLIEGLCQDPDAVPEHGLDDTLGSGDFVLDGHECKLCEEIFEGTEELLEHYEKVHPVIAEHSGEEDESRDGRDDEVDGKDDGIDNRKDKPAVEDGVDGKKVEENKDEAKIAEQDQEVLQPTNSEQEDNKSPEKKETRRKRMEKERVKRIYR